MNPTTETRNLSQVIFDATLYPRKGHDPATVQRYESNLEEIEARQNLISISTDGTLLDGRHRQLAYMKRMRKDKQEDREIQILVWPVETRAEKYALACQLNSEHGLSPTEADKKQQVIRMYSEFGYTLKEAAKFASIRYKKASIWTEAIRAEKKKQENEMIFDMWLACHTEKEIEAETGISRQTINRKTKEFAQKVPGSFLGKTYEKDADWKPPIYNVWTFAKKTNGVSHFGNSEQRILENLLYLYTEPFDIVFDPFGGGGSTIDVCKKRLRRYWVSDRLPIVERENEIRQLDILQETPALRWGNVALTYLDPPYWKQAQGKYSTDAADLANMTLEDFTKAMEKIIQSIAIKQKRGIIAMLMQPTQWNADNKQYTDHITDIIKAVNTKKLILENRVSCPYSTQQCNAQMVEWAKENRQLLVISRELVIWRINA